MAVTAAFAVPHPPLIIPEIGKGREREIDSTISSYEEAAALIREQRPETVVILSPHAAMYADYIHISPGRTAHGDFGAFGAPQVRFAEDYDVEFSERLTEEARRAGVAAGTSGEREAALDHGVMVPLYFLHQAGVSCPIVRIGLSGLSSEAHYSLGRCLAGTAEALDRRVVVIASGDLSHKLKQDGPYGFAPEGPEFDQRLTQDLAAGRLKALLSYDGKFCDRAAECGLRAFIIMAGALHGLSVSPRLLSYEGPFGVGYAVAAFLAEEGDACVRLARRSLEHRVRTGRRLALPADLPSELRDRRAGAFVSLKLCGQLRGCIGTIQPVQESLAEEIINNAVSAGLQDPRFMPVREAELPYLTYSVDVLSPPEPVTTKAQLDVKRYGVIVTRGGRRGLLLPNLEGVDTVKEQLAIACEKAGISPDAPYDLERFEVVRHQ